ncbi:hypothetical protein JD969_13850 [Planctomycetota bacterium]|nr:hypothetical protein JD969_13850 [Planctomycetota bacterium]
MFTSIKTLSFITLLAFITLTIGCAAAPEGEDVADKRADILKMQRETLDRLYKDIPDTKKEIADAPGYGVFSNVGYTVIIANWGNGFGLIHNNKTDQNTYMNVEQWGGGIGAGARDFKMVIVFEKEGVMEDLLDNGWTWGGEGSATFKSEKDKNKDQEEGNEDEGANASDAGFTNGIKIYELADKGFILTGNVSGLTFKQDDELNGKKPADKEKADEKSKKDSDADRDKDNDS